MTYLLNILASTHIADLIKKMVNAPSWKLGLYILLGAIFQFFAPIADLIVAIAVLIIVDYFTGVAAAKKRSEVVVISNSWKRTGFKITGYIMLLIATETLNIIFLSQFDIKLSYGTAVSIVLIEVQSISENTGIDILSKIKTFITNDRNKS